MNAQKHLGLILILSMKMSFFVTKRKFSGPQIQSLQDGLLPGIYKCSRHEELPSTSSLLLR